MVDPAGSSVPALTFWELVSPPFHPPPKMIPRNSKSELRFYSGLVWPASWMEKPLDWETEKVSMKMRSGHRAEGQRMMGDISRVFYRPGAWWRLQDVLIKNIYIYERERGLLPGRQRKQHFSIGEYDIFFMDLPFHIIGQNTCYAGLSSLWANW